MTRWLFAGVVGVVLTGFTFLLITGNYTNDGPVLVKLTGAHGLHAGDLFVIGGWLCAMAALAALTAGPRTADAPDVGQR
ncbi:hypothetical protein [Blastococcus tunisiensis]|uniref:Uncharacterized protein n=1 Tax=Blastococcus tunisiensis TaxID=1798228 RepID=A0A1I1XBG4_9ACTN|nr:hypothetical protein [Blastococcus sp. DSM 46838]SFE04744.1 hypothetical protein SAMN05216574_10220 [Blastococcus sp. DSM 46838]